VSVLIMTSRNDRFIKVSSRPHIFIHAIRMPDR
jgi:hypothetical protein